MKWNAGVCIALGIVLGAALFATVLSIATSSTWLHENAASLFGVVVGSFAAAYAGAVGAQWITERGKRREELLQEIRNTNTATMLAFGICNSLLVAKSQHVKQLWEEYQSEKASFIEHLQRAIAGEPIPGGVPRFKADLKTLPPLDVPIRQLERQVFEKISVAGRPILTLPTLAATVSGTNAAIATRNEWIEQRKANPVPPKAFAALYFGEEEKNEYASVLEAIYQQLDFGIFFSSLLCKDLSEHAVEAVSQFRSLFGGQPPRASEPDFKKAEEAGLMPDPKEYEDWMKMFKRDEGAARPSQTQNNS